MVGLTAKVGYMEQISFGEDGENAEKWRAFVGGWL